MAFIAYGAHAFNVTPVADDWGALVLPDHQYRLQVSVGRWLQAVVWALLDDKVFASSFTVSAFFILNALAALLTLKWLSIDGAFNRFVFLGLFLFFPFWAENFAVNQNHVALGLAVLLAILSGLSGLIAVDCFARRGSQVETAKLCAWILLGALLFSLSASLNQALAPLTPMTMLAVGLRKLLGSQEEARTTKAALTIILAGAVICLLGLLFYAVEVYYSQKIMNVTALEGSYRLSNSLIGSLSEAQDTIIGFLDFFSSFLFESTHLFPLSSKIVFLAAIILSAQAIILAGIKRKRFGHKAAFIFWCGLFLFGILVLPWVLGMLREENTYRYRALMPVAMSYAVVIAIALAWAAPSFIRALMQIACLVTIAIFVFEQSAASNITIINQKRDIAFGSRLVERMKSAPAYQAEDTGSISVRDVNLFNMLKIHW